MVVKHDSEVVDVVVAEELMVDASVVNATVEELAE